MAPGKTTLLRVLAGLLRPHAGEAHVMGASLPGEAWKLRGKVGLVAHEPLLYRDLTPLARTFASTRDCTASRKTAAMPSSTPSG